VDIFLTGTDTGVGKTFVTSLLLRALGSAGRRSAGYKPICCGDRRDVGELLDASSVDLEPDEMNPVWLRTPASPAAAAIIENTVVDRAELVRGYQEIAAKCDDVLVEGAGGWEVPLGIGTSMSDFASDLGLPVLVVVDNRLGALNHTLLTVAAIQARGLQCIGVILNHTEDERDIASVTNRQILEEHLGVPILLEILHGEDALDPKALDFLTQVG